MATKILGSTGMQKFENIIKSEIDKRLYRGLRLENGLKVLLISDNDTDKSAASLTVSIGIMNEPKELPGLAHFLEHMLFLGSKKYPDENDYHKFVSEHGGMTNAYTAETETNYFFDISPQHLIDGLDRFAQFFIEPLFTVSAVDREVNAVNSEHEKNIPSDAWRIMQVEKTTSDPEHPYNHFGTGNVESLDRIPKQEGIVVRDRLIEFHKENYSANIMHLAVLGKESLDELEQLVIQTFSKVPNRNVSKYECIVSPLRSEDLKKRLYILPVKDIRKLKVVFPIPDLTALYKSSPDSYISHLIGHEGEGSLYAFLREEGLVNQLNSGVSRVVRGFSEFQVNMDLTIEGIERINDIVTYVFQYIKLINHDGIQEWIHEENKILEQLTFRFKDKESPGGYVTKLSSSMQDFCFQDILCAHYALEEWNPNYIKDLLNYLKPENMRILIIGKQFENKTDQVEKWYGTKYGLEDIADEEIKALKKVGLSEKFKLPPRNEFIPRDTALLPQEENNPKYPYILYESSICRAWFKQDNEYLLPKNNVTMEVFNPIAYVSPKNSCLLALFVTLFKDALNEYAYLADLAGLKWAINITKYGFAIVVTGYNEKLPLLLRKIFEKLSNFEIEEKRFHIFKETSIRALKNFESEQPHQHAQFYLNLLLTECAWTKSEKLDACVSVTMEDIKRFAHDLLSEVYMQILIHGNCDKPHAMEIINIIEEPFKSLPGLLPQQLIGSRELQLNEDCNYTYSVNHIYHSSSCISVYYQCGLESTANNITTELFGQIISEPCYDKLRTQEQLGYIVTSGVHRRNGIQGVIVLVQSERHPQYVNNRIEEFLSNFGVKLKEMTDEEFARHKKSLADRRLEKPKQMSALTARFFKEISGRYYNFDRANIEVQHLHSITKDEIVKFFEEFISSKSARRCKIAVHVYSEVTKPEIPTDVVEKSDVITDVIVFKSSHSLSPLPIPFINVPPIGTKSKL